MFGRILILGTVVSLLGAVPTWSQCQPQKLFGSHAKPFDYFGKSASIDGETLVVGAYAVNNNNSGDAYVFELQNGAWQQTARLRQSDSDNGGDQFGNSVGISGDTIVVSAEFNNNEWGNSAGAAYVFERSGSDWVQTAKLLASDGDGSQKFAESVAAGGNGTILAIGNRQDQDGGNNVGAVYVFEKVGGEWVETAKLKASNFKRNDLFGDTVAMGGERILVGCYRSDASGPKSGSGYIFEKVGGQWTEMAQLVADDKGGELGRGVSLDGDRALLGARLAGDAGESSGAAYVFDKVGNDWVLSQKLVPKLAAAGDWIGEAVALDGDLALVSGHKHDYRGTNSGLAFLFELRNGQWVEAASFAPRDLSGYDEFSHAVALSGTTGLLTSPFDNNNTGSAYVFELGDCATLANIQPYGMNAGGSNVARLDSSSTPLPGEALQFDVTNASGGTGGLVLLSLRQAQIGLLGGTLLIDPTVILARFSFPLVDDKASIVWDLPALAAGLTLYAQAGIFDPSQVKNVALSNGLEIAVGE